jgi:hypothetical protein
MNLLETFLLFERENNLTNLKYNGIHFWRLVRSELMDKLQQTIDRSEDFKSNLINKTIPLFIDALKYSKNLRIVNNNVYERLVLTSGRFFTEDGIQFDLFLQKEIEKQNTLTIHNADSNGNHVFLQKDKVVFEDLFFLYWRSIFHLIKRFKNPNVKEFICLENEFNQHFGVEFNVSKLILDKILLFKLDNKIYSRFLKKTKPKEIVLTNHYGSPTALISLANKLEIKVTEYQHGLINKTHLGYHFPGRNTVPYYPDELVLYGEYWRHQFQPPKNTKIRVQLNAYYQRRINEIRHSNKNYQFDILAISNEYNFNKVVLDFAESHLELKILLKLHPGSNGLLNVDGLHYLSYNQSTNLKIIYNEYNLYDCISLCNKAIGTNSTGIFESVASGKETYVLKPEFQPKIFTELIKDGYAVGLNSLEEIIPNRNNNLSNDLSIFFG